MMPLRRLNSCDLPEGHVATGGDVDPYIAHRIDCLTVLGFPADDQVETAVAFEHLGHRLSADGSLHDGRDVTAIEAVTCRRRAIAFDDNIGLAEGPEHENVGDASDLPEDLG